MGTRGGTQGLRHQPSLLSPLTLATDISQRYPGALPATGMPAVEETRRPVSYLTQSTEGLSLFFFLLSPQKSTREVADLYSHSKESTDQVALGRKELGKGTRKKKKTSDLPLARPDLVRASACGG